MNNIDQHLSPFILHLNVEKADKIAIADIISSDPYIVVYVGDKIIGKTPVIYQCLSPVWNAKFVFPLLHLKSKLTLELFDKDNNKNDDFLGKIEVEISSLPLKSESSITIPVQQGDSSFKPQGTITFSAFVEVKETLIAIQSIQLLESSRTLLKEKGNFGVKSQFARQIEVQMKLKASADQKWAEDNEREVNKILAETLSSDPVGYALKDCAIYKFKKYHNTFMIKDVLYDVYSISARAKEALKYASVLENGDESKVKEFKDSVLRSQINVTPMNFIFCNHMSEKSFAREPRSSSKLNMRLINEENQMLVTDFNVTPSSPELYSGLRLELYHLNMQNDIISIYTNGVYMTWLLLRSLRKFLSAWQSASKKHGTSDLADFTCPVIVEFENKTGGSSGFGAENIGGYALLSLSKPFELLIVDASNNEHKYSIGLDNLVNITVCEDAPLPHDSAAVVEVVLLDLVGNSDASSGNVEHCMDISEEQKKGWHLGKFANAGAGFLKKTGKGVFKGVLNTAKGAVKGDVGAMVAPTGAAISSLGHAVQGTLSVGTAPEYYVIIKEKCCSLRTRQAKVFGSGNCVEFKDMFSFPIQSKYLLEPDVNHGILVFVFQAPERLIGQMFIPYNSLLHAHKAGKETKLATKSKHLNNDNSESKVEDIADITVSESDFPLNVALTYSVTVVKATGVGGESQSSREFFVKCRFAKWSGEKIGEDAKELRTKTAKSVNNPEFNEELELTAEDGLFLADFVRLEVFHASSGLSIKPNRVGSLLLPISEFHFEEQVGEFPLQILKKLPYSLVKAGLGTLTVKFRKHGFPSECSASIRLRTTVRRCNEYTTFWSADCVLAGSILQDKEFVHNPSKCLHASEQFNKDSKANNFFIEKYAVAPSYDGLLLVDSRNTDRFNDFVAHGGSMGGKFNFVGKLTDGIGHIGRTLKEDVKDVVKFGKNITEDTIRTIKRPSSSPRPNLANTAAYRQESGISFGNHGAPALSQDPEISTNSQVSHHINHDEVVNDDEASKRIYISVIDDIYAKEPGIGPGRIKIVEVFEYDRRSIFPPYEWNNTAKPDFECENPEYADELGSHKAPFKFREEALPPLGCSWLEESWTLDFKYTKCDESGWSYGMTVGLLRSNLKKKSSSSSPIGAVVRRRKWMRRCILVEIDDLSDLSERPSFKESHDSSKKDSSPSQKSPPKPVTTEIPSRKSLQNSLGPDAVFALCEERGNSVETCNHILIPWEQVPLDAVFVVTPSVLIISCCIHKYIGDCKSPANSQSAKSKDEFREAGVEIFIWGCPAEKLRSLIEERRAVYLLRRDIGDVLASGTTSLDILRARTKSGMEVASPAPMNRTASISKLISKAEAVVFQGAESVDEAFIPETVELSLGVVTITQLDDLLSDLEKRQEKLRIQYEEQVENLKKSFRSRVPVRRTSKSEESDDRFLDGFLRIKTIVCSNLKNVEVMGSNDVFVVVSLGNWTERTTVMADAGSKASFDFLGFSVPVTEDVLQLDTLLVQVFDKNTVRADVLIGEAKVSLLPAYASIGEFIEVAVDIVDHRFKVAGKVVLTMSAKASSVDMDLDESDEVMVSVGNSELNKLILERFIILRRVARIKVYIGALLGAGLEGDHDFQTAEITQLILDDLKAAEGIDQGNEVDTASNRIQYLLDTAEMRIRNTALTGWNQREGGVFEVAMQTMVNSYFIAMVQLLGKFFENKGIGISAVKGVNSKVKLIKFFMHNDSRLQEVVEQSLRPYMLTATPSASFSLCLDLDTLLDWYSNALQQEMYLYVDNTLRVWKDPTKNANTDFVFPLPWRPNKPKDDDNHFRSEIPEDVMAALRNYIQYAGVETSNLPRLYLSKIRRLNMSVRYVFTDSFAYLSRQYADTLREKDWTCGPCSSGKPHKDPIPENVVDEMYENISYLCSVANDCYRVRMSDIISLSEKPAGEKSAVSAKRVSTADASLLAYEALCSKALDDAQFSYQLVQTSALDFLACVEFSFATSLSSPDFFNEWEKSCNSAIDPAVRNKNGPIYSAIRFFQDDLPTFEGLLSFDCFLEFMEHCAEKIVICILSLIKWIHDNRDIRFDYQPSETGGNKNQYSDQLIMDMHRIRDTFAEVMDNVLKSCPKESAHYNNYGLRPISDLIEDILTPKFVVFEQIEVFLTASPKSEIFFTTMQQAIETSRKESDVIACQKGVRASNNEEAYTAAFLKTVVELRYRRKALESEKMSESASDTSVSMSTNDIVTQNLPPVPVDSRKGRGSIGNFFNNLLGKSTAPSPPTSSSLGGIFDVRLTGKREISLTEDIADDDEFFSIQIMVNNIVATAENNGKLNRINAAASDAIALHMMSPIRRVFDNVTLITVVGSQTGGSRLSEKKFSSVSLFQQLLMSAYPLSFVLRNSMVNAIHTTENLPGTKVISAIANVFKWNGQKKEGVAQESVAVTPQIAAAIDVSGLSLMNLLPYGRGNIDTYIEISAARYDENGNIQQFGKIKKSKIAYNNANPKFDEEIPLELFSDDIGVLLQIYYSGNLFNSFVGSVVIQCENLLGVKVIEGNYDIVWQDGVQAVMEKKFTTNNAPLPPAPKLHACVRLRK